MIVLPTDYYAGLFEGDGSIYFSNYHNHPVLQYKATDEDIVERMASMWDRKCGAKDRSATRKAGHKDQWITAISGKNALPHMRTLYPYLWTDRREQSRVCFGYSSSISLPTPSIPWLAGLLEAEGHFNMCSGGPVIDLKMTDHDVMSAVHEAYAPQYKLSPKWEKLSTKWAYDLSICSRTALNLMEAVLPYMGSRKGATISYILQNARVRKGR